MKKQKKQELTDEVLVRSKRSASGEGICKYKKGDWSQCDQLTQVLTNTNTNTNARHNTYAQYTIQQRYIVEYMFEKRRLKVYLTKSFELIFVSYYVALLYPLSPPPHFPLPQRTSSDIYETSSSRCKKTLPLLYAIM